MLPSVSTAEPAPGTAPVSATPDGIEPAVNRLERQFTVLYAAYRQRMRDQTVAVDPALQPSGYRTLIQLVLGGRSGAGDLAEALGFDKSVLSRQLHHLESLGLISRDRDPADKRSIIISPTPEAISRVDRVRREARDDFRSRLGSWPQRDVDELHRLLGNLL
jgi:DNA-binding MarR family transcriptional regulator